MTNVESSMIFKSCSLEVIMRGLRDTESVEGKSGEICFGFSSCIYVFEFDHDWWVVTRSLGQKRRIHISLILKETRSSYFQLPPYSSSRPTLQLCPRTP
jgi:hypothetical protein